MLPAATQFDEHLESSMYEMLVGFSVKPIFRNKLF